MTTFHASMKKLLDLLCPTCRKNQEMDLAGVPVECNHLVHCRNWRTHGQCKECGVATEHVARLLGWAKRMVSSVLVRDREVEAFLAEADETLRRLREGSVLPRKTDAP